MSNLKKIQELVAQTLDVDFQTIKSSSHLISNSNILMVSLTPSLEVIPPRYKGGIIILANENGETMLGSSGMTEKELLQEFMFGKRTDVNQIKYTPSKLLNILKDKIMQMPTSQKFTISNLLAEIAKFDDRKQREACYQLCYWLEKNNFVDFKISTNNLTPFGEESLHLLNDELVLKQEKDNFAKFENLEYEYMCCKNIGRLLDRFKITKNYVACLTEANKDLFIIDDAAKMKKIYKDFQNFIKLANPQEKTKKGLHTGVLPISKWYKKSIFKKTPEAYDSAKFFTKVFAENGIEIPSLHS